VARYARSKKKSDYDGDEIGDFKFVEQNEALVLVGDMLRQCLSQCIEAIKSEKSEYVEIATNETSAAYKTG